MILELLVAFGLTSLTVMLHAWGTFQALGQLARRKRQPRASTALLACERQLIAVASFLLLLHLLESASWAVWHWLSGALPDLETALYFSLASYTTVGYGDVVLPAQSRLLGPIEAGVGILMFGWSTAILVAAIPRIYGGRLLQQSDSPSDRTSP